MAAVGFPDIGLQDFLTTKHTNYTKIKRQVRSVSAFVCLVYFVVKSFPLLLAKGEIQSLSSAGDDPRYFQISAPVQPGNSGGALVDERGNVIGIVSAKVLVHGHRCGGTLARAGRCRRM